MANEKKITMTQEGYDELVKELKWREGEERERIKNESRRFSVQEVIDFIDLPVLDNGESVPRKADLRAFVLTGAEGVDVWPSGLTRFSRIPESFVINSSQGGGFKDTWVMAR